MSEHERQRYRRAVDIVGSGDAIEDFNQLQTESFSG